MKREKDKCKMLFDSGDMGSHSTGFSRRQAVESHHFSDLLLSFPSLLERVGIMPVAHSCFSAILFPYLYLYLYYYYLEHHHSGSLFQFFHCCFTFCFTQFSTFPQKSLKYF